MVILLTLWGRIFRFASMSQASFLLLQSLGAIRKEMVSVDDYDEL